MKLFHCYLLRLYMYISYQVFKKIILIIFGNSQLCAVELKILLFCQAIFMFTGTKYFCR